MKLVAAALAAPFDRDVTAGLARVERALVSARERGARLLVLPESALGGYLREPGPEASAPDIPTGLDPDGPEIARLIELAGDVVVCAGYTEAADGGLYASAVCVSGDGVLGHQRKVHLPPAERFAYTAGDGFAAFDTPVGRRRDAALLRQALPRGGARARPRRRRHHLLAVGVAGRSPCTPRPTSATTVQTRHFDLCDQTRAVENQVFVVSANQTGPWGPLHFLGSAKVVDPSGAVLARTGADEGLAVAEVELAAVARDPRSASTTSPTGVPMPTRRRCPRRRRSASLTEPTGCHTQTHVRHRRGARTR